MSSHQNTKSLAVNGVPSDHREPLRSETVIVFPPSETSHDFASDGTTFVPVLSQNRMPSVETIRLPFSASPGPVKARRQMPPYLPISWSGLMTIGSSETRCSTGGSLPALTSSASIGASPSLAGFGAFGTMSGPSSFPMYWRPGFASGAFAAGLATSAGLAASAGSAPALARPLVRQPPASRPRLALPPLLASRPVASAGFDADGASVGFAAGAAGAHAASRPNPARPKTTRCTSARRDILGFIPIGDLPVCSSPRQHRRGPRSGR